MCCHQQLRVIHRHVTLGPYNTAHLIMFLYALQEALLRREQRGDEQAEHPMYVVIWDNVNFHRGPRIREWFENNPRFINVCLPPYSPFLNPIEEFFSAWRWKVYDRNPYAQENLIQSMDAACDNIGVEAIQAWIRHAKGFFPRCLARDRIACDVDEVLCMMLRQNDSKTLLAIDLLHILFVTTFICVQDCASTS